MTRTDTTTETRIDDRGNYTVQVTRLDSEGLRTTFRTSDVDADDVDSVILDMEAGWTLTRTRQMTVNNMVRCAAGGCVNRTIRLDGICPHPHEPISDPFAGIVDVKHNDGWDAS